MHTEKLERAIPRPYLKNKKKYTENPKRAIPRGYQKSTNTSSTKPNIEKGNRLIDSMNDFASAITKEFGFKVRSPVSVVVEVVRNSQEIEYLKYDEDTNISLLLKSLTTLKS